MSNDKFTYLRNKYPTFIYEGYQYYSDSSNIYIKYNFNISEEIYFNPELTIEKKDYINIDVSNDEFFDYLVFHLGLIELISYWKATCSKEIIIKPSALNKQQAQWWKYLYYHGLGEFFHVNNINTNIDDFVTIIPNNNDIPQFYTKKIDTKGNLIPVGGGKDSSLTLEVLSEQYNNNDCFLLNPLQSSLNVCDKAGYDKQKQIAVKRVIDKRLLELNNEGYLNGHTPFSAVLAFLTLLVSYIYRKKYIILSNESSANESTVKNSMVNHQYSKTFDFEKRFDDYVKTYMTKDINYFSILRPLNELQIAKYFSKYEKYLKVFRSCNVGNRKNIWCGRCPKCLFVYIILSPFIDENMLVEIFGDNLLDKPYMEKYFRELTALDDIKPFECVGTIEDVKSALSIYYKNKTTKDLPYLIDKYKEHFDSYDFHIQLSFYNNEHIIPHVFENLIKKEVSKDE